MFLKEEKEIYNADEKEIFKQETSVIISMKKTDSEYFKELAWERNLFLLNHL